MSWVATAIVGGAIIGAVGSKKAADVQREGYDAASAEQARQYDITREDYAPYREAGAGALNRLTSASEGDFSQFLASPGYEFRRSEGIRDIGNTFSARGSGGNALKALAEYNSGLASNEFGNWWNRQAGLAGIGQTATAGTAYAGQNAANQISRNYIGAGDARASGVAGVSNAVTGGIGNFLYARGAGLFGQQQTPVSTPPYVPPQPFWGGPI